jgi:transmembrane sensor
LKPGQEAVFENANDIRIINDPDAVGAIAWKNGQIHFTEADITTVMREIERWYDLEVVYKGSKTTDKFIGDIPRTATLTELLSILQMAKVHFKLERNKLTVLQ